MTDSIREAAEQARQALEGWANHDEWVWPESALVQAKRNTVEALTALNAALAHPEPAGEVTDEKAWEQAKEKAWDKYQTTGYQGERFMYDRDFDSAVDFIRDELAPSRRAPVQPAEGEVAELVEALLEEAAEDEIHDHMRVMNRPTIRRIAALLEHHQPPQPVAVSERLPDESDPSECLMPQGECWWFDPGIDATDGAWYLDTFQGNYTHWLPHNALPLPSTPEAP